MKTRVRRRALAPRKRAAILVSGRGANMVALIAAAKRPEYPAEIALVLSNKSAAAGLALANHVRHLNPVAAREDVVDLDVKLRRHSLASVADASH